VKIIKFILITILLLSGIVSCSDLNDNKSGVNTAHLDYLYEDIEVNGIEMAIIHIYSNYPDYKYIDDDDEGTACIDDAARAAIFYLNNFNFSHDSQNLTKNKKLLEFVIYLQSESGYFYNFIWPDHSINKDFKTSVAEPNWWSWRALWALTESYPYYKDSDLVFAEKMRISIDKLISAVKMQIPENITLENINGLEIPTYLPYKHASDQASILLIGLLNYYNQMDDKIIYDYIKILTKGIMQMQISDANSPAFGVFLSWETLWHAWGNNQAYALLKSYQLIKDDKILQSALKELNNYYPLLLENGFDNSFTVSKMNDNILVEDYTKYPQIAYNIRPMVFALIEAYKITNDEKYAQLAGKIGRWFIGNNPVGATMYNEKTGLVFDGIESEEKINMNSGAESTIEALLSILKIKNNKSALKAYSLE